VKYGVTITLTGVALITICKNANPLLCALGIWLGGNFILLGVAHFGRNHRIFGKRADGRLRAWSFVLFFPLVIVNTTIWHHARFLGSEPSLNKVTDDLFVGRRLLSAEVPQEFANYVDLTAEFQEPQKPRLTAGYVAFPILDGAAPTLDELDAVISRLRPGSTFIHCAQGHGRTGLVALAILLSRGAVDRVDDGLALLRKARPGIRLNGDQLRCIEAYADRLRASLPQRR